MEQDKRNIQLTIEEARKLYKEGDDNIKSLILASFSVDELNPFPKWKKIKTFQDACDALNLDTTDAMYDLSRIHFFGKHLMAVYKMDIIRNALNEGWKPIDTKGKIYYPAINFYLDDSKKKFRNKDKLLSFISVNKKFLITSNTVYNDYYNSSVYPYIGMLGCQSVEIAIHMGKYFTKEIFDACYSQYFNCYKWVN